MEKIRELLGYRRPKPMSEILYRQAMSSSSDLVEQLRHPPSELNAARSISAAVWARARNVPVLVTVYEAVQEMRQATPRARDP